MWLLGIVLGLIALLFLILFLKNFYMKAARDTALIRTGFGGQKIIVDGGTIALPILHRIERINMRSTRLSVERRGVAALMSGDRLRVDLALEFRVRVAPSFDMIATAAQALGPMAFRETAMQSLIEGTLIDAIQAEIAQRSMDQLHDDRKGLCLAIRTQLEEGLGQLGLVLDSVALTHLDQTPLGVVDDNNAFNAVGLRRLAGLIAENRKARIEIETEADIIVGRRQLAQAQARIMIEREQQEAEISSRQEIEQHRIGSDSILQDKRIKAESMGEEGRIAKIAAVKQAEIACDLSLRKCEIEALLEVETAKLEQSIQLAAKREAETIEQAKAETARIRIVEAQQEVQTAQEIAAAERVRSLALVRSAQEAETEEAKIKVQTHMLRATAQAESENAQLRSDSERNRMIAEAQGRAAMVAAENGQSDTVLQARIEMHKLDKMPEIATQMMKPVEKIESIRINQIGGFGGGTGMGNGSESNSPFSQALESVLGMSVQLPMMKKLGDEIGLDFDMQLAGRTADAAGRAAAAQRSSASGKEETQKKK